MSKSNLTSEVVPEHTLRRGENRRKLEPVLWKGEIPSQKGRRGLGHGNFFIFRGSKLL